MERNMMNDTTKVEPEEFFGIIRKWWNKRNSKQRIKVNSQRERYIEILQKRYGFTKEKAKSELDTHYSKIIFD
jgi:hypothetical protein